MRLLRGRLGRLERLRRAHDDALGPPILVVYPDDWPVADRATWDAEWLVGDTAARAALVAEHVAPAPGPVTAAVG